MFTDLDKESKYTLQNTHIILDKEYKNKLHKLCTSNTTDEIEITIKFEYNFYFNFLFKNTFLPNTIINLICAMVNDEIILKIKNILKPCLYCEIFICVQTTEYSYINFNKLQFDFTINVCPLLRMKKRLADIQVGNNILSYPCDINKVYVSGLNLIYDNTLLAMEIFKKIENIQYYFGIMIRIVDYNLWMKICMIIYTIYYNTNSS